MSTFNIIKQINKNYIVFFVLLSISSISILFQSFSLENNNKIIKETYGISYKHFLWRLIMLTLYLP